LTILTSIYRTFSWISFTCINPPCTIINSISICPSTTWSVCIIWEEITTSPSIMMIHRCSCSTWISTYWIRSTWTTSFTRRTTWFRIIWWTTCNSFRWTTAVCIRSKATFPTSIITSITFRTTSRRTCRSRWRISRYRILVSNPSSPRFLTSIITIIISIWSVTPSSIITCNCFRYSAT